MPQLRQNIITGDWVVIAPERAKRPNDYVVADKVKRQAKGDCVFCEGKDEYKKRLKEYDSKNIWVIPNKFPVFIEKHQDPSLRSYKVENAFYRGRASTGGHDVVVVRDHDTDLYDFPQNIWVEMLEAFKKRYLHFKNEDCVAYTMPIYNHGPEAGASIEHPHAQIFASNIIPNIISREIHHTEKYFEHNGVCAFCDLLNHEHKFKARVVAENNDFLAFTFYAARFPFEVWVLPKIHQSRFEFETNGKYNNFAKILIEVFAKLGKALNKPSVNFFIHNLPNTISETDYYHWHLEIAPRITGYGGYEMGSETIIDVFSPEAAAKFLTSQHIRGKKGK